MSSSSTYKSSFLPSRYPIASVAEKVEAAVKPSPTGVDLYARFAIAGAVCCSVTHGGLTPVDVVKTRIQLEPEVYNKVRYPLIDVFAQVLLLTTKTQNFSTSSL